MEDKMFCPISRSAKVMAFYAQSTKSG